jgi:hypothetical protein
MLMTIFPINRCYEVTSANGCSAQPGNYDGQMRATPNRAKARDHGHQLPRASHRNLLSAGPR